MSWWSPSRKQLLGRLTVCSIFISTYFSRVMRKPDFCLCENQDADQLCSKCIADLRLCFRCSHSTIPLLLKSKISRFQLSTVTVHVGLCQTWSETPKTFFCVAAHFSLWLGVGTDLVPVLCTDLRDLRPDPHIFVVEI